MTSKSMDLKNTAEKLGKDWVLGGSWLITVAIVSPITKTWCCGTPSKGLTEWDDPPSFPRFSRGNRPRQAGFFFRCCRPGNGRVDAEIGSGHTLSINQQLGYLLCSASSSCCFFKARWWSRFTFERVTFSSSQKSDKESPGRWCFLHFLLLPFRKFRKWSEMIQFDQYVSIGLKPPTGKVLLVRLTFFLVGK